MNEIMCFIDCYLKLKEDFKEYNKENLFDVYYLFENEVAELNEIVRLITTKIHKMVFKEYKEEEEIVVETILEDEENLVNEIADVIFTCTRLIKEFNLQEPLIEMMEYKYHRQLIREEKKKNEGLK